MERIPEAEQAVLDVLWAEAPLSAAQVTERVAPKRGWSLPTVKTLLSRLVAREAVAYEVEGRAFLYRPAVSREDVATVESRRLLDRLFGGRAAPLVAHLAERQALSPEDVADIEAVIARLKA